MILVACLLNGLTTTRAFTRVVDPYYGTNQNLECEGPVRRIPGFFT